MRTLTSTLTAAQKTPSARPAVLVAVRDRVGGAKRLIWSQLYDGAEADSYHAAVCPADSSLVRARTDGTSLYRQRVASPGALSDYSAWTLFSGVMLITGKGIALATTAEKVALVYTALDGAANKLYCVESADSGATWGTPAVIIAAAAAADFEHVAVAYDSSDILVCFYTTGASSETLKRIIRTAGTWGGAASWSNTANAITGIAASRAPLVDIHLLVTGKITSTVTYHLWGCVYGLGINQANDTWSALKEIRKAHYGAGATYLYPSIAWVDVYRESFVETFSGSQSYSRVMGTHSQSAAAFIANLHHDDYRLPVMAGSYGYAIAGNATHIFLSTPGELYWNTDTVTTTTVSADVLSLRQSIKPFSPGELHVVLDNSDGAYNTPAFAIGNEVDFQPGYYGTSGAEYSSGQAYFIESLEHIAEPGKAQLVIHAVDAWGLLARMQARTAVEFNRTSNDKTYQDLVEYFLGLAGITLTVVSSSSPFTTEYPRISIHSGQSYAAFIKGLYERLNDVIYVRGAAARSFNPSSADAADYTYGGSNHPVTGGRYTTNALSANRFQVQGTAVYADSFEQTQTNQLYARYRPFTDVNASTVAKATAIAAALSNKEAFHAYGGELAISGVNCGQELYDMIAVTDSRVGLSAAKRRVFSIELAYEPWKGRYQMSIGLAGPQ